MKTITLQDAAILLKMTPEGLRRKAIAGKIPAIKPGKCWVFIENDLVEYMRSLYSNAAESSQGVIKSVRRKKWRSTKEEISGGYTLTTKEIAYRKAVGHPIK